MPSAPALYSLHTTRQRKQCLRVRCAGGFVRAGARTQAATHRSTTEGHRRPPRNHTLRCAAHTPTLCVPSVRSAPQCAMRRPPTTHDVCALECERTCALGGRLVCRLALGPAGGWRPWRRSSCGRSGGHGEWCRCRWCWRCRHLPLHNGDERCDNAFQRVDLGEECVRVGAGWGHCGVQGLRGGWRQARATRRT